MKILILTVMASLVLMPCLAFGEDASVSIGGSIVGQKAHGDFIYVAQRDTIVVFDAKDKKHLRTIGRFTEDGRFNNIFLKWPVIFYAYHHTGSYYSRLGSVDVTDPANPKKIELINAGAAKAFEIATSGSLLLTFNQHVRVYDIANPLKPVERESIYDSDSVKWPREPKPAFKIPGEVLYSGHVHNVKVIGNKAYVLDDQPGLKAFDVSDRANPKYLGTAKDPKPIRAQMKLKKSGGEKGLVYKGCKIRIVYDEPTTETQDYNHRIVVEKNSKIVATVKKWFGAGTGTENVDDYWLSGDWLIVCGNESTTAGKQNYIEVYDIKNPEKPIEAGGWFEFDQTPEQACVQGGFVYTAEGKDGLSIKRIGN